MIQTKSVEDHGKISTTNTDALLRVFFALASELEADLDTMFKNYNRLIQEGKNKLDIQIKATKKEKMRHFQYYAREEIIFWQDYPRKKKFYNRGLAQIKDLCCQERWRDEEIRDLEHVIHAVMDLLPTCSQKYNQIFALEIDLQRKVKAGSQLTFDKVTENLRMFDSNDTRNWQILGYTITLLVSDALAVLMDPSNRGAPIFIGSDATSTILQQVILFSKRLARQAEDDENQVEDTISHQMYAQIQSTWESQIFHYLSKSSRANFDICLKFISSALNHDHRKYEESIYREFIDQVYFGRYLAIAPTHMDMGAKVLQLLDTFLSVLQQKGVGSVVRLILLQSLRHLMEFLWFGSDESYVIGHLQYDSESMKILWSSVSKIFTLAEHLAQRKEILREEAHLLMAQILKISTDDFIDQNQAKFLQTIKFDGNQFISKQSDGLRQLKLLNQLIIGGHTYKKGFKAWRPRTQALQMFYREDGTKIYTPVEYRHASLVHVRLQRYFIGIFQLFRDVFSPKQGLAVEFQHWQLLEKLSYDNLEKVVEICLPHLFGFLSQESGIEFLNLGLKLAAYILDPSFGYKKRYKELKPFCDQLDSLIAKVRSLTTKAIQDIFESQHFRSPFMQQCIHGFRNPQITDQLSAWSILSAPRTQPQLARQHKGQFYLQNKARSITFDDQNEMQRLDFTYDHELLNQTFLQLQKTSSVDKAKESFLRNRILCQLQAGEQQYPQLAQLKQEQLTMVSQAVSLLPWIDFSEQMMKMPCYQVSLKGDFQLKAQPNDLNLLAEVATCLPTYLLLALDTKIQQKAHKSILKMMVSHSIQVKLALLDQLCYLIKEMMLDGDAKLLKSLQFCLCNCLKTFLWCERSKITLAEDPKTTQIHKQQATEIKFIYKYLHVFRICDMLAIVGLCNKDIEVRQVSVLTLCDLGKLKRLIVKKDLWTPLLDDLLYENQFALIKGLAAKMAIVNGVRGLQNLDEAQLSQVHFYQLMIDNFEYNKYQMLEQQVRDLQVLYLGGLLRLYKEALLKEQEAHTEYVRDVSGGAIIQYLQTLSSRTLAEFENEQNSSALGFNLLSAIVVSNLTKSHQKTKQTKKSLQHTDEDEEETITSGDSISTNTILEEMKSLAQMVEQQLDWVYKMPFGKFAPARIWASNIILSFSYYMQDDHFTQAKSMENLLEVFNRNSLQTVLFFTILSLDPILQKYCEQNTAYLQHLVSQLQNVDQLDLSTRAKVVLKVNLTHNVCAILKTLPLQSTLVLAQPLQVSIMSWTREQFPQWKKERELEWLLPIVKDIWHCIIQFQSLQPESGDIISLDLKFLITMEQEGYQNSLNFYKQSKLTNKRRSETQDQQRVQEIKILIQHVYSFTPVKQKQEILFQKPTSLAQKNVYFKCLTSLVDTSSLRSLIEQGHWTDAQLSLAQSLCGLNVDRLIQSGLTCKLFFVCLYMSVTSIDKQFVEKARTISLTILPLMFQPDFQTQIYQLAQNYNVQELVHYESKSYYQFIKKVFRLEESFNQQQHFERYFSLSGFIRDVLNEIIKIQGNTEVKISPKLMLKVLDTLTYFFSEVQLRRSPQTQHQQQESDSFIFANLVDFKSFEFLSKLYKISERLVDYDTENMTVMNMWFKICEGRESNFEVLGKFLIHNLSSLLLKQELEIEKQKRYSLSIFNYIKARTQQVSVRSSIEINSQTWSQKMLKIVLNTKLNLTSKYTLEKVKLKKILEQLHLELNHPEVQTIQQLHDVRESISIQDLVKSQTFVNNFSSKKSDRASLNKLVFTLDRQIQDQFQAMTSQDVMPELLIRYFENTLILIANESERLQVIKFTAKEEMTITTLLLVLVADLQLNSKSKDNNNNRAYFLYDLLYKLSVQVNSEGRKYLKSITIDQFTAMDSDILKLFDCRQTFDVFGKFTSVYFKVLKNVIMMHRLYESLLSVYRQTLLKHHASVQKDFQGQILFGRSQLSHMLQTLFSIVHQGGGSNFESTVEVMLELVLPQAKHQAAFCGFGQQASQDVAWGTTIMYWVAFACMTTDKYQTVGTQLLRRIMEESEFYKFMLNQQQIPLTFNTHRLPQLRTSLLALLFRAVTNQTVSDDAFKCLIVSVKAQDSLLTTSCDNLAQEEFTRFLLLCPYLMSQFTLQWQDDVHSSVQVFSNKRQIIQLLKKSLPSISIGNKSKILQILDVIQREVDQDDQVLVNEQFQLLIDTVREQLLQTDYGAQLLTYCRSLLHLMLTNKVTSITRPVIQDCISRVAVTSEPHTETPILWQEQTLGEQTDRIPTEIRTLYFSLKHICIQEIEMLDRNIDCQHYFTGEVNRQSTSDPTQKAHQRTKSTDDPFKPAKLPIKKSHPNKRVEVVSKYSQQQNVFTQHTAVVVTEENKSPERLAVYKDHSDEESVQIKLPPVEHNSMLGTFAREDPINNNNNGNRRELEPTAMQMSISSISVQGTDKMQQAQDRPQTGQFINEEFDFSVDQPNQFRATQPVIKAQPMVETEKSRVVVDLKQNEWLSSSTQQQNQSQSKGRKPDFEKQLKMIAKDDDVLYEFEQHLQGEGIDLDQLAFYVKVLEFRQESTNRNIVAGLILDNYLSEEAEFYIGARFTDEQIEMVIEQFKEAITQEKQVAVTLFDECCQVLRPVLEPQVSEFMK